MTDTLKAGFNRFEYIGPGGRLLTLYGDFTVSEQDNNKTVKVFGDQPLEKHKFRSADLLTKGMTSAQPSPVNDELNELRLKAFKTNAAGDRDNLMYALLRHWSEGELVCRETLLGKQCEEIE